MKACKLWTLPGLMALAACAALGAASLPGCGVSTASQNAPQIAGRVTYQGKPVRGGAVVFLSSDRSKSSWGVGAIKEDGRFSIEVYQPGTTFALGRYDIV